MIPNSIKWRLQLWYGLVLVAVLAALGFTAYQLERSRIYQQVDAKLHERAKLLADALNGPPKRDDNIPPSQKPVEWNPPSAKNFHLSPRDQALFGSDFYFAITGADGAEIARSTQRASPPPVREAKIITPTGETIVVGHPTTTERAALRNVALKLAGVSGIILLCGLAVGWWLVSRALRPIDDISAAAEKIATGDLARRIHTAKTRGELGRLATVLNTTFTRLEAAFTVQRRFAADAAHELRTPVSVLIAQTHAALIKPRSCEENLQTIEACHRASQRMRRLIISLLQLARLDAGQEVPRRVPFDLLPVVSEAVALLQPLAEEKRVQFTLDLKPAQAMGDAEQIHQVVTNLVANAIQFSQPGDQVCVAIHAEAGRVRLQVTDTGIGIPVEDLPHIFERFYRADKSRSDGNAGLGLAISKLIVEAHGGSIAASRRPVQGAEFVVELPSAPRATD